MFCQCGEKHSSGCGSTEGWPSAEPTGGNTPPYTPFPVVIDTQEGDSARARPGSVDGGVGEGVVGVEPWRTREAVGRRTSTSMVGPAPRGAP